MGQSRILEVLPGEGDTSRDMWSVVRAPESTCSLLTSMGSRLSAYLLSPGTDQTPGQEGMLRHVHQRDEWTGTWTAAPVHWPGKESTRYCWRTSSVWSSDMTILYSGAISSSVGAGGAHSGPSLHRALPTHLLCGLVMPRPSITDAGRSRIKTKLYISRYEYLYEPSWSHQQILQELKVSRYCAWVTDCLCILAAKKYSFQANNSALHWEGFLVLQNPRGSLYLRTSTHQTVKPKYNTINHATEIRSGQPVLGLWFPKDFTKSLLHEKKMSICEPLLLLPK